MIRTAALLVLAALLQDSDRKREAALLGMRFRDATADERKAAGLERGGAKILSVWPGSGAEKAGLKAGDVIVKVGSADFPNADDFIKKLYMSRYDALTIIRGKASDEVAVTLKDLDTGPKAGDKAPDFTLKTDDGKSEITLSKLVGRRPVVVVFGSYT